MRRLILGSGMLALLVTAPGCSALDGSAKKINSIAEKIEAWTSGGAAKVVDGTLNAVGLPAVGGMVSNIASGVKGLTAGSVKYSESLAHLGEAVDEVKASSENPPPSTGTLGAIAAMGLAYAGNKLRLKWLKTPA